LAMTLPKGDPDFVDGFAQGFAQLAQSYRLALVGGDTTRGALTISVAVHGFVPPDKVLTRAGAKPGDSIFVTGTLGDAAGGLQLLKRSDNDARSAFLIERLNRPTPRIAAGLALRGYATACIDISDGLLADLGHICTTSHVGAQIDAALLPRSCALLDLFDDTTSRDFALSGGDDYELCFTVPLQHVAAVQSDLAQMGCGATKIGRIVEGSDVSVRGADGQLLELQHRGWNHFTS
jgi:thiamine-monophosphate kinase